MLPRIEISTAEFFPAKNISQIIDHCENGLKFKYIENTEAFLSWGDHNYIRITSRFSEEMMFEKTETTHILVMALSLLYQYRRTTGEFGNVG